MPRKKALLHNSIGKIALCYIRQSYTRDEEDTNSQERQRANIQRICDEHGWIPEWYEDVGGHRSGTSEERRPAWTALKNRLGDKDVVALIANDLSRLHRNLSGVSQLIDTLERYGVNLVLAAWNSDIDVTTLTGQMFAQMRGLMDAFYAKDISAKAKDSIEYRKRLGKVIGQPPFGTTRNKDGFLSPSDAGAWLLADGRFVGGTQNNPAEPEAIWRGYYECAYLILSLYATGNYGLDRIAYHLNDEGWAFRDRWGHPRPLERDDIRRVVANFPEYGGLVVGLRGKDRAAYEDGQQAEGFAFIEERAVFPIELLKNVARVRQERTIRPVDQGINWEVHVYPLANITFCAHCDQLAEKHQNPNLRSRFGGNTSYGKRRYRHKAGVSCGCHNRSVICEEYEQDFARLITLLTIRPDAIDLMMELAIQAERKAGKKVVDMEEEKRQALALCRRRIDAAIHLYRDGRINREEYLADVERNEREIAHWEARTSETEQLAMELTMCLNAVERISRFWELSNDDERQAMARALFTELVYDLDSRRIVDFKLKPWADKFLMLRADLYENNEGDNNGDNGSADLRQDVTLQPCRGICWYSLEEATKMLLKTFYFNQPVPTLPKTTKIQNNLTVMSKFACAIPMARPLWI